MNPIFNIQTGNSWLQQELHKPRPHQLFGQFWHRHELCIMFADTNMGKSILAVQLGDSLSKAEPIGPLATTPQPLTVLYVDLELSAGQFAMRYTTADGETHPFAPNFHRAEFDTSAQGPDNDQPLEQLAAAALEQAVTATGAQVLIIDNITSLGNNTENAAGALPLMRHLNTLKNRHALSILVLAHTPKRNPYNPISRNDLQGSKMIINFADSAFAIGESHTQPGHRYLKQIKQRSGQEAYGAQNVCLLQQQRTGAFLHFVFEGYATEAAHLRRPSQQQREEMICRAAQLSKEGKTQRQIATELRVALSTANKLLHMAGADPAANEPTPPEKELTMRAQDAFPGITPDVAAKMRAQGGVVRRDATLTRPDGSRYTEPRYYRII
jgi:hypothetical protein